MYMKLTNSYKLVSFKILFVMKYKKCHIFTAKFINLCCLKTNELKALDCLRKTTSAFLLDRHVINV
ncbi:hypothetical protein CN676_18630 [Bacillus wiedmannii]|nr:hypothetical protein CON92_15065 [Bacillus wiedmannii]PEJ48940.1 hypothetical protein CN676_18630 [Bacillus wiedmannii]PGA35570.1 hypothetical protein COL74_06415 [Bacillus wiedmannii]PGE56608.1 hypothetical protein COM65_26475 [Bacillus wiedmannii]PHB59950.1 hypothetical protein COE87_26465 [Bacillus wiedmannii]